jgi:hypothetical protein
MNHKILFHILIDRFRNDNFGIVNDFAKSVLFYMEIANTFACINCLICTNNVQTQRPNVSSHTT